MWLFVDFLDDVTAVESRRQVDDNKTDDEDLQAEVVRF
jgi:hypothetical protein